MAAIGYLMIALRKARLTPIRLGFVAVFYLIFAVGLIPILH
jgi:cation:H+ antiporter